MNSVHKFVTLSATTNEKTQISAKKIPSFFIFLQFLSNIRSEKGKRNQARPQISILAHSSRQRQPMWRKSTQLRINGVVGSWPQRFSSSAFTQFQ
jgi:hypothetical protein